MKTEQLKDKFIICRTQDEFDFIAHQAMLLFGKRYASRPLPVVFRFKPIDGYGRFGFASIGFWHNEKEEECSVLFGNLVKEWVKNGRTTDGNSVP